MRRRFPVYLVYRRKIVGWRVLITRETLTLEDVAARAMATFTDPLYAAVLPDWDAVEVWSGSSLLTLRREPAQGG